jgi:hypothetical protein
VDLKQLLDSITPEVYGSLKRAIELGKWPDGRVLGSGQKDLCIQAVIAYDARKPADQRTGYVPPKTTACEPPAPDDDRPQPIQWKE